MSGAPSTPKIEEKSSTDQSDTVSKLSSFIDKEAGFKSEYLKEFLADKTSSISVVAGIFHSPAIKVTREMVRDAFVADMKAKFPERSSVSDKINELEKNVDRVSSSILKASRTYPVVNEDKEEKKVTNNKEDEKIIPKVDSKLANGDSIDLESLSPKMYITKKNGDVLATSDSIMGLIQRNLVAIKHVGTGELSIYTILFKGGILFHGALSEDQFKKFAFPNACYVWDNKDKLKCIRIGFSYLINDNDTIAIVNKFRAKAICETLQLKVEEVPTTVFQLALVSKRSKFQPRPIRKTGPPQNRSQSRRYRAADLNVSTDVDAQ